MPEPSQGTVEPVGMSPVGASGMPIQTPTSPEPMKDQVDEPASGSDDDFDDVDFEDLKSVPPQFQKIAKKLQGSFTKKMQALTAVEKNLPQREEPTNVQSNPQQDESKAKVMAYMNSPEGAALKEVFDSIVSEKLGTLPQDVQAQKIEREVSQVVAKYGEDVINSNYDAIEEAAKKYPTIPLDMIVSNVLFDKAKELGAEEYKSKIVRKATFSDPASQNSSNVVTKKESGSWEEAFENAKSTLGF